MRNWEAEMKGILRNHLNEIVCRSMDPFSAPYPGFKSLASDPSKNIFTTYMAYFCHNRNGPNSDIFVDRGWFDGSMWLP